MRIIWTAGQQYVLMPDNTKRPLWDVAHDAARYAWISSNYDQFRKLQELHPNGGCELEHAINEAMESKAEPLMDLVRQHEIMLKS
jgi:hypothetical protein